MAMRLYRLINILSLDIVAGAIACSLFFYKTFHVNVDIVALVILGLSVWVIYSIDHLLDAKRLKKSAASTARHRFFQKYFQTLVYASLVCTLGVTALLPFVSIRILSMGLGLILIVAVYLIAQRHLVFVKEFVGSLLYSAGIILPAIALKSGSISVTEAGLILQFIFVAWINLLIFSIFDKEADQRDRHVSFVARWGETSAVKLVLILFVFNGALLVWMLTESYARQSIIMFVMSALLVSIIFFKSSFDQSDRFRLLGDAVFLLPLLIWI